MTESPVWSLPQGITPPHKRQNSFACALRSAESLFFDSPHSIGGNSVTMFLARKEEFVRTAHSAKPLPGTGEADFATWANVVLQRTGSGNEPGVGRLDFLGTTLLCITTQPSRAGSCRTMDEVPLCQGAAGGLFQGSAAPLMMDRGSASPGGVLLAATSLCQTRYGH